MRKFVYPLQYDYLVRQYAYEDKVDPALVASVILVESKFDERAASQPGAHGLMQVMPATGQWVAGKLGMKGYHIGWLRDPDTNVMLGTTYMRMVLEGLDNHPVLASAAYNAGPGRARKWKDARPLEGAIYAETIPFGETRDYVKKVMANAVIYAALFEGRAPSLKARLGTIAASDGSTRGLGSAAPGAGLDEPTPGAGSNE